MSVLDFLDKKGYGRSLITDVAIGVKFIRKYGKKRIGCLSPSIQAEVLKIIDRECSWSGPGM